MALPERAAPDPAPPGRPVQPGPRPVPGPGGTAASAAALASVRAAAANAEQIVKGAGNGWGNPRTLADHFDRHGPDFGSPDEDAYAREAQDFLQRAVAERLPVKVAPDGTIRAYDPATNTFGAYNADGTTKTYFKPDLVKNPNYWADQEGADPWSEPAAGNPPGGEPVPPEAPPEVPPEIPFEIPILRTAVHG